MAQDSGPDAGPGDTVVDSEATVGSESQVGEGSDPLGRPEQVRDDDEERSLDRLVEEGRPRLHRTWAELLATGAVGGLEVGFGVLVFLAVEQATGSKLLAGLAFSIGFMALLLGHSELFTEGFLVPVAVVAAREASVRQLLQMWVATLLGNLLGGWVVAWLIMVGFPALHETALSDGQHFATATLSGETFALAVLAGAAITMLTRMRTGTRDDVARVIASVAIGFLIAGLGMFHSILDSILIFAGIQAGGHYTYRDWLLWFSWTVAGNIVGGIALTTLLRLVRGKERLKEWRTTPPKA
jgi:formate/nitrite transporter FocA (FNT family)